MGQVDLEDFAREERQLDLLAERIAEHLASRLHSPAPPETLIDASEVARITGKTRAWVYDHAGDLGAIRLGSGQRPRLGFFPARIYEHLEKVAEPTPQPPPQHAKPRRRRRSPHTVTRVKLLEIRPAIRANEP